MKYLLLLSFAFLGFISCDHTSGASSNIISSKEALNDAIANAQPGDHIILANGVWKDVQIRLTTSGTKDHPITFRAETPGSVLITGKSDLKLGGEHIIVDGLYFVNGESPSRSVVEFATSKDTVANHCVLTNCVIEDYNKAQRNFQDLWVIFKGRHNQMDHCYLAGKSNRGPTVRVDLEGNRNINNYHKIVDNHFGPRPPKGGPSAETIQIGNSYTSMSPSYTLVANNLFEECNGEVEIISSKTNFNEFRNNVFYKSEGSLVTRHGNYCTVDGNYFIGDELSSNEGGVRLIGTGHTVTNNYFYNLSGTEFRSPLAVMNGIPKSPLNRYIQVTDVTVAHNTWVNCKSPWHFGVGSNVSMKDVLPASEIRSARPIRTTVANNLIYNTKGDLAPYVAHDKLDGILFESNLINNQGFSFEERKGIEPSTFTLKEVSENLLVPDTGFPNTEVYAGFEFDQFDKDLFGNSRTTKNAIGAIVQTPKTATKILDRSKYGTSWYKTGEVKNTPTKHKVTSKMNLNDAIRDANNGDIIVLADGKYSIDKSLKIDKRITLTSEQKEFGVNIVYRGPSSTPLFEMNPKADLTLYGVKIQGDNSNYAFAPLARGMSSHYNLKTENCQVAKFDFILKAHKYSFAEHLIFQSTSFMNCENGMELSEEKEDKGEYNAENITIKDCQFQGINKNVLDYYRGGYDESTVGGNLSIKDSYFTQCGSKEKNGILLNTYGIINVDISDNRFLNNNVQQVAQLWGAKNNSHENNTISKSGKIVVEENLKLKLFY